MRLHNTGVISTFSATQSAQLMGRPYRAALARQRMRLVTGHNDRMGHMAGECLAGESSRLVERGGISSGKLQTK